jgi:hypothetical protein
MTSDAEDLHTRAGQCGSCAHAIIRPTRRGTVYLRCAITATDERYPKYPRLPRLECDGHETADACA